MLIMVQSFNSFVLYKENSNLPSVVYHGTTAERGREIKNKGFLTPRGIEPGNWGGGLSGGNPSNPDLVYCVIHKDTAVDYAKDIARKHKTNEASIIALKPDYGYVIPDEDSINDILNRTTPLSNPKIWQAYASVLGVDVKQAHDIYNDDTSDVSDSQFAENMKDTALELSKILSIPELTHLIMNQNVMAFSVPLRVIRVALFAV